MASPRVLRAGKAAEMFQAVLLGGASMDPEDMLPSLWLSGKALSLRAIERIDFKKDGDRGGT